MSFAVMAVLTAGPARATGLANFGCTNSDGCRALSVDEPVGFKRFDKVSDFRGMELRCTSLLRLSPRRD